MIVSAFGGAYRGQLTREATHLLAAAPTGSKYERAVRYGRECGISIVSPHWSVRLGA